MSKKLVNVCDRCGRDCEWDSYYAKVGRSMDAAGSMETETEAVDLCFGCAHMVLRTMVETMDYEQARAWVKLAKTKPKPVRV